MKLSEAILLGSTMSPQRFGPACKGDPPEDKRRCVIEAAVEAIGEPAHVSNDRRWFGVDVTNYRALWKAWPWCATHKPQYSCPHAVCGLPSPVWPLLFHLNDVHHWTRPEIAAWVATIEPQDAPLLEHQPPSETHDTSPECAHAGVAQ